MRRTKIVCTIGPASDGLLEELIAAGMDVARLNFSHGTMEEQGERIRRLRKAAEAVQRPLAILLDIQGPKIRIGQMAPDTVLVPGQRFSLVCDDPSLVGDSTKAAVSYPHLYRLVRPRSTIYLDDGLIEVRVEEVKDKTIHGVVVVGGPLTSRKGLLLPDVDLDLPAMTERDKEHLRYGVALGVDLIAASFVRKAEHVRAVRNVIREAGGDQPIIAKIENRQGVEHLEEIIQESDGVMVARGDLGVHIPPEEVPLVQKQIIEMGNRYGKPVITATQMLESMVSNPRPTRAEVTDVATAIFDGTDAIMLSGETAMGKYPVQAVRVMDRIARRIERSVDYADLLNRRQTSPRPTISEAISHATCRAAADLKAAAIVTSTQSGFTARMVSKFRPPTPIIALTPVPDVARRLMVVWGVEPIIVPPTGQVDEMLDLAFDVVRRRPDIKPGDRIVITAGVRTGEPGSTNLLQVHEVDRL